jgi:hypothetical protein
MGRQFQQKTLDKLSSVKTLYINDSLGLKQISELIGVASLTISSYLRSVGVELRPVGKTNRPPSTNPRHYPYKNGIKAHILVATKALGRTLPERSHVHHVNENRQDYSNQNLVICQDKSYHRLLHYRSNAYNATGNADSRKCDYCKQWELPDSPNIEGCSNTLYPYQFRHKKCQQYASKAYFDKRIAAGLCRDCGLHRGVDGSNSRCRSCLDKKNRARRLDGGN